MASFIKMVIFFLICIIFCSWLLLIASRKKNKKKNFETTVEYISYLFITLNEKFIAIV